MQICTTSSWNWSLIIVIFFNQSFIFLWLKLVTFVCYNVQNNDDHFVHTRRWFRCNRRSWCYYNIRWSGRRNQWQRRVQWVNAKKKGRERSSTRQLQAKSVKSPRGRPKVSTSTPPEGVIPPQPEPGEINDDIHKIKSLFNINTWKWMVIHATQEELNTESEV